MKLNLKVTSLALGAAALSLAGNTVAQTNTTSVTSPTYPTYTTNGPNPDLFSVDDHFTTGWHEVGLNLGAYFSNVVRANNRPNIDYAMVGLQAGYMVTEAKGDSWYRGSFEIAPEIFGSAIFDGPGNYVAGGTLWFRYNFVPKGWKLVPYIQGGGGATWVDIPHSYDGKDFNFNLEAGVGVHYFISSCVALNAEYRLQHISNADLWDHNVGINVSGPVVGISYFF